MVAHWSTGFQKLSPALWRGLLVSVTFEIKKGRSGGGEGGVDPSGEDLHIKSTVVPVLVVPLSKWFGIVRVSSLKRSTAGDFLQ